MKIAFELTGGDTWVAGLSYVKTFLSALKYTYGGEVTSYVFLPSTSPLEDLGEGQGNTVTIASYPEWTAFWVGEQAMKWLFAYDFKRIRALKQNRIDVVFGPVLLYRYGGTPTLSWIPDFQHVHLPEMFSAPERSQRDRAFLRTAKISSRIVVTSESVRRDLEVFSPQYADKVRVLHAVSYIPESIYGDDPKSILDFYHLPEKFVYIPNQFWKHKNHELVLRSLKILKERNLRVSLVGSGYPGDYRHPGYFASLLQMLSQWGLRDQVIFLGLIPRDHMFLLMRQAICVLNPSLFEGFGLTVDEARSVGKRVLLSDIPVHREQNPPKATFFDPHDCGDLVEKLKEIWQEAAPGPDAALEQEARESSRERLRAYAESFMSVVCEVAP